MIGELEKSWKTSRFLTGKTRREVVSGRGWSNNFDSRHTGFKMPQTHLVRDAIQSGERCRTSAMRHASFFSNQTDVLLLRDSMQYVTIISLSQCYAVLGHFCHVRLCDAMVSSLPGSWVRGSFPGKNTRVGCHALLQGIFPKWVKWKSLSCAWLFSIPWTSPWNSPGQNTGLGTFPFSRGSSQPRDWTQISHIAGRFFTSWATREAQPRDQIYLSYISLWKLGSLPLAPPEKSFSLLLLLLLGCFNRVWPCVIPQTAAHQALPSLGFSRQEHWSGLPFPSPMHESEKWKWSRSVVSDSSQPHGLQPTRLLCPWDFPGKSTGVGCPCCSNVSLSSPSSLPMQILFTFWVFSSKISFCIRLSPNTLTHTSIFAALRVSLKLSSNLMPHHLDRVLLHYTWI